MKQLVGTLGVALLLLLSYNNLFAKLDISSGMEWIHSLNLPSRFVIFFFIHTIAVVGCFPGTVAIEMGAGLSMNIYYGFVCMYTSKLLAAMVSFVLARSILYRWTQKRLEQYPRAQHWISAIAKQGWRLALFSRLSPIPSFINNYLIALSPISFVDYMIATSIGIIPFLFQIVVLGAGIQDVHRHLSWTTITKYGFILVGIVGLGFVMNRTYHSMMQWDEEEE